jgi:plastocyanin
MRNQILAGVLVAPLLGAALATAALPQTPSKPAHHVAIAGFAFKPAQLTVKAGETVTFVNNDDETHTATAVDRTFDSGHLDHNAQFSYTFTKPGTYPYHCLIHTSMTGTIVVTPPGSDR